jgi:2Fe-2S ferredoxin
MFKRLFRLGKREETKNRRPPADLPDGEAVMTLAGRTVTRRVVPVVGCSVLELADRNGVDWLSNCKRGTCARCRCLVTEGAEYLTAPNEAELRRLEEEELRQGYRLGCQARVERPGPVAVRHAPYF